MSWSVQATGKPAAVAAAIEAQFATQEKYRGLEPEESIKQAVRQVLRQAIAAQADKDVAITASASGSMSYEQPNTATTIVKSNTVNVKVEPIFGFVE